MNILFFDDNKERHKIFKQRTIGTKVTHTYDVEETLKLLKNKYDFDFIFLDYDMTNIMATDITNSKNTGMEVVNFIIENKENFKNCQFVIHSLNLIGGGEMAYKLNKAKLKVVHQSGAFNYVVWDGKNLHIKTKWEILENE